MSKKITDIAMHSMMWSYHKSNESFTTYSKYTPRAAINVLTNSHSTDEIFNPVDYVVICILLFHISLMQNQPGAFFSNISIFVWNNCAIHNFVMEFHHEKLSDATLLTWISNYMPNKV